MERTIASLEEKGRHNEPIRGKNDSLEATIDYDWERIGRRIRQRRLQLGLSTQEVADKSGIGRATVVRVEAGKPCRPATLQRLRHVLTLFTDFLLRDDPPFDFCIQDRPEERQWMVSRGKATYQRHGPISNPIHENDPQERLRLGLLGFQPFFTCTLNSSLADGIMNQGLMELYDESWVDSHAGEEFIYCLRGRARIKVRDQTFLLDEGGALVFRASDPHQYAPAEPVGPENSPPLLLIVVAMQKGDKTREVPKDP